MLRKILGTCGLILFLVACRGEDIPLEAPTLDATRLNETAVSLVTRDYAKTQTRIPTETPTPAPTGTPIPTLDRTRPSVFTPTSELACNMAAAGQPIDITIPDDTKMAPGAPFSKTWRLKNVGNCTWTRLYTVSFFSGNSLGAQYTQYLQQPVNPGDIVDLTVDMVAPDRIGVYQSNWMLSDPGGALFGIGPHGDAPFWVRIEVVQMITNTPQPTATQTPTPVVYVLGTAELRHGDQLDLDAAVVNPSDGETADLLYQYGGTPTHLFTSLNAMQWVSVGLTEPNLKDCVDASLSEIAIGYNQLPVGNYFCYQTSGNLPGWLLIESFSGGKLTLSFLTWSLP
jgi:hypothetical protein